MSVRLGVQKCESETRSECVCVCDREEGGGHSPPQPCVPEILSSTLLIKAPCYSPGSRHAVGGQAMGPDQEALASVTCAAAPPGCRNGLLGAPVKPQLALIMTSIIQAGVLRVSVSPPAGTLRI